MSDKKLFELLKDFATYAGEISLPYYGKIASSSKSILIHGKMRESPVTALDHGIQELLLAELMRKGFTDVAFNGEEESHLKFFFRTDYNNGVTVHCDPIDGTRSFVSGKLPYCTGYALSRAKNGKHEFFSSVVYDPVQKILYSSFKGEASVHVKSKKAPKTYTGLHGLSAAEKKKMVDLGYVHVDAGTAHLSIIDVALGRIGAYLHYPIQVHDALVPFSFAQNYGVLPYDGKGKPLESFTLTHSSSGFSRIPKLGYFANDKIRDELLPLLMDPKFSD
jgi:fructose-1,6-bisphosphatase/inositol monophosphatase family enzyme